MNLRDAQQKGCDKARREACQETPKFRPEDTESTSEFDCAAVQRTKTHACSRFCNCECYELSRRVQAERFALQTVVYKVSKGGQRAKSDIKTS